MRKTTSWSAERLGVICPDRRLPHRKAKICLTNLEFLITFSTQYIRNFEADFPLKIMKIISSSLNRRSLIALLAVTAVAGVVEKIPAAGQTPVIPVIVKDTTFSALGKPIDEAAKKAIIIGIDSGADSKSFTAFLQTDEPGSMCCQSRENGRRP
jgi:hypothetical protein